MDLPALGMDLPTITWERNLLQIARKPFWCLELSAINIHFMSFAYGQIHFYGDIAMATLSLLPSYSDIATLIFESWSTYYICLHKLNHIWQWVVNTQVISLLWRDLELSGFTMPLLGNLHSYALHTFSQDFMNSPTSC